VANIYGKELLKTIAKTRTLAPLKPDEVLHAQTDGSMLFTRDGGWKEVKVGRIFKSSDCIAPNDKQCRISHSHYLAHLENSTTFTPKMEQIIKSYGSIKQWLVFLNDGTTWIRQWVEDPYPNAISI